MIKRKSIGRRLSYSFMSIIIISTSIFIIMVSLFLRQYYYKSVEYMLTDQVNMSVNFYSQYFADTSLQDNVRDNVDVFWKFTSAQVQIIDNDGQILMDSIGANFVDKLDTADVQKAIEGQKGKWVGRMPYSDEMVMSIAQPLEINEDIVGVLRFITSLNPVNEQLRGIIRVFFLLGILTIFISGIFSMGLARGVVNPIRQVTQVAERMAKGDLDVRSTKISHDEVGRLSDTLNYMANEIVKKDKIKNEFLASVSHELRTPLTSIKGWAIILNHTDPNEESTFQEGLGIIEKETQRLSEMVEELLDFSRLLSGNLALKKVKINLVDLVGYIKVHMTPVARRNNIDFIVKYDGDVLHADVDENRIKQVLINVLHNAFKFTEQGGRVEFTTFQSDKHIVMEVKDNGCGIPPEDLQNVKEKFFKGKNSKSSSGIGLSISHEIIEKHGGELVIESQENVGTQVYIKLPIN